MKNLILVKAIENMNKRIEILKNILDTQMEINSSQSEINLDLLKQINNLQKEIDELKGNK